jgi:hypothetical protein
MPICPFLSRRQTARVLFALALGLFSPAPPAQAQDVVTDFFGSLFGAHHAPPPGAQRRRPARQPKAPHATTAPETERTWSAPSHVSGPAAGPAPDRPPPSFFVAVIGDSEAGMLAQGLSEAFADDPRIGILNKAREDTGLVRDDFFDWRQAAKSLLEGPQHIDMAVIQIGINDNQRLRTGDNGIEPLSKPFNEIYAKRVEEIAAAFRDKNIPLIWVGLPIMRSESLSNAALVFNDIDRQYAGALGAHFVDLWEPFSDVNSAYKASGPDVNGVIMRLRAADGVHFNKAGARKAAHFVEPEIRHVLEASLQPAPTLAPTEPNPSPAPAPGPSEVAPEQAQPASPPPKPLAGKIQPLTEPAVSPGGALAAAPAAAPHMPAAASLMPAAAATPEAAASQPGRADDFHWPEK